MTARILVTGSRRFGDADLALTALSEARWKFGPFFVVVLGDAEGAGELPGMHGGRADVADLARLDDVVQCFERFLNRRVIVPAMDLVEVDVIGAESLQAGVDLSHDRLARQAGAIRAGAHPAIDLGGDHDLLAAGKILDCPAEDFFAAAE